ncbi:MAG: hypothetical protein WC314_08630 [Vulcanimicrobiota bacterium]
MKKVTNSLVNLGATTALFWGLTAAVVAQPSSPPVGDTLPPPERLPNRVIVEVYLHPTETEVRGPEFAQDNPDMVEDALGTPNSFFEESDDLIPLNWYPDDGKFLRKKNH